MPKRRAASKPSDRFTLPDGRTLGYAEYGAPDGLPVFAFHGTPGSRFMLRAGDPIARAEGVRLIAPERPGYGLSTPQPGRTLADWPRDVAALARALGVQRYAVLGISGGGPYAAACAALLPEAVAAAAMVCPVGPVAGPERPPRIGARHYSTFQLLPRAPLVYRGAFNVGRLGFLHAPLAIYALLMARAGPEDWRILSRRDVRLSLLSGVSEGVRPGVRGALDEMRVFSQAWRLPLSDIRAPCFLWQGMRDRNVPPEAALRLGELIPQCRVVRLENAGHYWIFDNFGHVLNTLKDAVAATPKAARRSPSVEP
ncbi:MAG: alpha/beta fold hydrolase [Hyphomicrobiales bacterium]|nr:alpha/beta fold hydrolase [Hyphomicrobiales bacterium]